MKRFLIVPLALGLFVACNSGDKAPDVKKEAPAANNLSADPDYTKGLELIAQSDCLTCHAVEDKINGPSYREVANKYAGMADTIVSHLAKKIIEGGSGVWGTVPMTPHPAISQGDAEAMVKYVLLLKK